MSVGTKIVENTAVILSTRLFNMGLGIATVYVLTRFIGPGGYGVYMTVFAYVAVAANLVEFGFRPTLTREMSKQREDVDVLAGNVMVVKFLLAVIVVAGLNLAAYVFKEDPKTSELMLLYSMSLFLLVPVFESTFAANLDAKIPSLLRTAQRTILLLLVLLVVYAGGTLLHIVLVELAAGFLYVFSGYFMAGKYLRPRFLLDRTLWKELMVASWPLGIFLMLDQMLHRIDIIILSILEGQTSVGIYSLASRLTQFLELFVAALMVSVFPLLCRYFGSDNERFEALWRLSYKYLMAFIVLVALVVSCLAGRLIGILAGPQFAESAMALQVLVWSQVFFYARAITANIFIATGDRKLVVGLALTAALGNIGLDFLLIPQLGYMGACWGTLISYGILFPLAYSVRDARPYIQGILASLLRPAVGVAAAYSSILLLGLSDAGTVVVATVVYCGTLILTRGFTKEDIGIIQGISTGNFNWRNLKS